MNEDMNEQEGIRPSGEEAFLGSNFTISSQSHHCSVSVLFQRRAVSEKSSSQLYFRHCSLRHMLYEVATGMPQIARTQEALLPLLLFNQSTLLHV